MKYYFSLKFKSLKAFFNHAHKGFTLIETLITVGILAILLAVSIPSAITIQKNLKMQELDDIARQIFLSAQGELTEMKSSGRLETFRKELTPAYDGQKLTLMPSDYDMADLEWKKFYYLNDTNDIMKKHIIREVSSLGAYLEGGSFIVELNPVSGDIYGVFYSQKPTILYSYVIDPEKVPNRGRDGRVDAQLGYYGGEAGSSASSTLPAIFFPNIEVINDEDLYLKFSCSNLQALLRTQGSLTITITAKDEADSVWTKDLKGGTDFTVNATGNTSCNILLDSLRAGESFAQITKLKAGDNIKVTAKLVYDNGIDPAITGDATEIEFNSLFGSKKVDIVTGETQIDIAKLRHLNNLRGSIYKENLPTGKITLNQGSSIDFDVSNWKKEKNDVMPTKAKPTLTSFSAIANKALLERNTGAEITYTGNGNELRNFPLVASTTPTENVGLFATAKNMTFNGMRLIDFSVNNIAYSNVGMLVGTLTGGTVTDVRAHLSTIDLDKHHYGNKMPDRLLKYNIKAKSNVGGLIGLADGATNIEGSFAAVPITATNNVGGLVGSFAGGRIANSYGSGNITASSHAGGLVGLISGSATVTNCYSTSNVTANGYAGGLVGRTTAASNFTNGRSYGLVIRSDNAIDNNTSGAFVGSQVQANTYDADCLYLRQGSYNNYTGASAKYGTPTVHSNLLSSPANSAENSHPYMIELHGQTFPFPMRTTIIDATETRLPHYGDWVEATTMQTSLVYYEKYRDDNGVESYAYYAKTSLSTIGGTAEPASNLWVINTLEDKPCIEDGYAIMTIFQLSKFDYKLENGAQQTITTVETVADVNNIKTQAPLIQSGVTVQFKKDDLTQEIKNARVYRLPFHLQVAERTGALSFFLKLNVNGFVGEKKVIDNFNFYYCPDFAKNAVNPELGNTDFGKDPPKDPTGEENPVYVRSPRQLNGLSRYNYYWNDVNSGKRFYFKQETELDYSTYVTNYCGEVYDLMDTRASNKYRNRPIGRPHNNNGGQFRNIYDGNFKKIIDYCCETYETENQFTGLFGEVRECTLKNIVLTASSPGDEGVASTAYVKSHFNSGGFRSGTGALVGLVYVAPEDHYDDTEATVFNCFVSGYDVIADTESSITIDVAAGGLVGYNFGVIKNSSANSKTVAANQRGNSKRYLGGIAGSINGKGIIENCYAGGVLKTNSATSNLIVGGLVAGINNIPGWGNGDFNKRDQRIRNSYSHCTWNKDNLKNGEFYPSAPTVDKIHVTNCYYLTNSADQIITDKFITNNNVTGKDYGALRDMALTHLPTELSDFRKAEVTHPWLIKATSYPFPAIVKNKSGQFVHYGDWYVSNIVVPTAIFTYYEEYSDEKGNKSYGYQFAETAGIKELKDGLKNNTYDITMAGYGVLVLDKEDSLANVWVNGNNPVSLVPSIANFTAASGDNYKLQPLDDTSLSAALQATATTPNVVLGYNTIKDGVTAIPPDQGLYVNFNFAATVSLKPLVSTAASPTQVRTERQLRNLDKLNNGYYKMTHNIVISIREGITGNLTNNGYTFDGGYVAGGNWAEYSYIDRYVGKNGNYIYGLKAPLFASNSGTGIVKNIALLGVNVQDGFAALVVHNSGLINNCFAQGDVANNGVAAGLVYSNSGTIQSSYFSGNVIAVGNAAGFVFTNSNIISDCYAVGEVKSLGLSGVAGFVHMNGNNITNSYSAMKVTGSGNKYGFAASGHAITLTKCYWLKDNGKNINVDVVDNKMGISMSVDFMAKNLLSQINSQINGNNIWAIGRTAFPFPNLLNGSTYPYPSLISQDFYGNWWT